MSRYLLPLGLLAICIYPLVFSDSALVMDPAQIFLSPNLSHLGGTDSLGRDLLQRTMLGAGISLLICFFSLVLTYALGLVAGSLLSYWHRANHLMIFFLDVFDSVPNFLLVALFSILLNKGIGGAQSTETAFMILVAAISLATWGPVARNVRLEILQLKGKDYLNAAIIAGGGPLHIARVHYFRAIWPWLRISIIHNIPQFLLIESVLSFTGFGMNSHNATLGYLIYEGWKNALMFPHLFIVPSLILCLLVFFLTRRIQAVE